MTDTNLVPLWPDGHVAQALVSAEIISGEEPRRMLRNVSQPTLEAMLPDPERANGTAIVSCPGGAFHFLSIDNEGYEIGRWLNRLGIATFILRYRLVPTPTDDDFATVMANPTPHRPKMDAVRPAVVADGLRAVEIVRGRATEWNVDPAKIGIIGFSAGAQASIGAATKYLDGASRPDSAATIYGEWWEQWIPDDAPPMLISACSNDPLIDVTASTGLDGAWYRKGLPAELHLYADGGHGYGIREQGLPVHTWKERFIEWLRAGGFCRVRFGTVPRAQGPGLHRQTPVGVHP